MKLNINILGLELNAFLTWCLCTGQHLPTPSINNKRTQLIWIFVINFLMYVVMYITFYFRFVKFPVGHVLTNVLGYRHGYRNRKLNTKW